jgi:peptidoglycan hydrolase-like protein with peptidoglycan-binding domain
MKMANWLLGLLGLICLFYSIVILKESREASQAEPESLRIIEQIDLSRADISRIQEALVKADYLRHKPNGLLNAATTRAIRNFQIDNLLMVTGRPTAETLRLLRVSLQSDTSKVGTANRGVFRRQTAQGKIP